MKIILGIILGIAISQTLVMGDLSSSIQELKGKITDITIKAQKVRKW